MREEKEKTRFPEIAVGALILNPQGEILLIKSSKWHNLYCLPGGHIERGESIKETLKRELLEEVNLRIKLGEFLCVQESIDSSEFHRPVHFVLLNYLCYVQHPEQIKIDEIEAQEFIWVSPENSLGLSLNTPTKNTIEFFLQRKK